LQADPQVHWHGIAQLLGGVGLFLLGMTLLTEGLKSLAGPGLRRSLQRVTARPARGFGAGVAMTVATQASSATVLATIGFVTAGMLTTASAVPVVAGATVGTSSTTWIVATVGLSRDASSVLMPLVAVGALLRALGRGPWRHAGTAIAGAAVLLLAIAVVREGVGDVAALLDLGSREATSVAGRLGTVAIGILLGVAMQSSAAPIALAIVGLQGGAIAWDVAAHLAVGASVGTTSTGLLATLGTRASARRIAAAWATCASVQAAIAMLAFAPLAWFAHAVGAAAGSMLGAPEGPVAIAAFHTAFTGLGLVPLVAAPRAWARAIAFFVPDTSGIPPVVQYDRSALEVPGVAAATARRGLLQAAAAVTDLGLAALRGRDGALEDRIDNASLSLEATREFLGEIAVPEGDRGTVDLQRGSVGALDHLARLVGDVRNLRRIGHAPATAPEVDEYLAEAAAALEAFRSWLADPSSPLPLASLKAASSALGARRKAERTAALNRTATGALDPERAIRGLDAMRYADHMAHHAAKAASYLAGNGATRAPGTAGAQEQDEPA
jgi:phosphate:Na+ symporter